MPSITATGIDERTSQADIQRLLDAGAEVAVLWTENPEGRQRYPSHHWIRAMVSKIRGPMALHVCGSKVRARLLTKSPFVGFVYGFQRIQVNGTVSLSALAKIASWRVEIITQDTTANFPLRDAEVGNHTILVDGSGGRGELPRCWYAPVTTKRVGFAGGLGPHNLREELPKIMQVATGDWWIDMETGVRSDDWFDVEKALEAVMVFSEIVKG
jgi:hypothetical protein